MRIIKSWYVLILLCGIFTLYGCTIESRDTSNKELEKVLIQSFIEVFEEGFEKGLGCAEEALKQGHTIDYCYKILNDMRNEVETL